jgi:hypothetical protein
MIITLSEIVSAAKSKPTGFLEEALKRGVVKNECLELSNADYEFLKTFTGKKGEVVATQAQPSINIIQEKTSEPILEIVSTSEKQKRLAVQIES